MSAVKQWLHDMIGEQPVQDVDGFFQEAIDIVERNEPAKVIREDADRFHPRSDGADFRIEQQADEPASIPAFTDDFPIDDEAVIVESGRNEALHNRITELTCENDRLKADVKSLERELEYERKRLQNMTTTRDEWRELAKEV